MARTSTRGHEGRLHQGLKPLAKATCEAAGYDFTLCEHQSSDVVAVRWRDGTLERIALEIECSPRHAVENFRRNISRACEVSICVCPDLRTAGAVVRRLLRELETSELERVGILTANALTRLQARESVVAPGADQKPTE